jgi:hypothetical protein
MPRWRIKLSTLEYISSSYWGGECIFCFDKSGEAVGGCEAGKISEMLQRPRISLSKSDWKDSRGTVVVSFLD